MTSTNRYRTRVIAVVHSHLSPESQKSGINLSNDIIQFNTSKSIKGAGGLSLVLVPRKNYMNLIFPNDIINLYIDTGTGNGFVRTFFGYVDRIIRSQAVTNENGATSTVYKIVCTDMTKSFDRTDIYWNPALSNRKDLLDQRFGNSILGGHALRTRGITAYGSPADMVENLLTLLLGFGAQWTLPACYPRDRIRKNIERRIQRTKNRIPGKEVEQVSGILGVDVENLDKALSLDNTEVNLKLFTNEDVIAGFISGDINAALEAKKEKKAQLSKLFEGSLAIKAYKTVLQESNASNVDSTILDLLDLSFIEAMTIDGFITSTSVWVHQGTLASAMYGYSNERLNELFFDLRPVAKGNNKGYEDSCFGKQYSTDEDDLGINKDGIEGFRGAPPAIEYRPAVVMREYPFSTVEGVDLSETYLGIEGADVGFVPFGPIFSQKEKNSNPHRIIYDYGEVPEVANNKTSTFVATSCSFQKDSKPLKHLDVIPITDEDVIMSEVGRSDHDIFNLFAVYSSDLNQNYKFLLEEFMPILTHVSIARHGLRVQEYTTSFANYAASDICPTATSITGSTVDNSQIRRKLIRWALLLDHWNQHNSEYLNGTIKLRGMPEIRVGYRLDWVDRKESYYVEGVNHDWQYEKEIVTTVNVSRGQRNDPFPVYIPPSVSKTAGSKKIKKVSQNAVATPTKENRQWPYSVVSFVSPIDGAVIGSGWGRNRPDDKDGNPRTHTGIDIFVPIGTAVKAIESGTVKKVILRPDATTGTGTYIELEHNGGFRSRYLHLSNALVTKGTTVERGQVIGFSGATGTKWNKVPAKPNTAPHLHFDLLLDSEAKDKYIQTFGTPSNGFGKTLAGKTLVPSEPFIPVKAYNNTTLELDRQLKVPLYREVAKKQANKQDTVPVEEIVATQVSSFSIFGGGDRSKNGRLALYFKVITDQATVRSTEKETFDLFSEENEVDIEPGGKGVVIYPNLAAPRNFTETVPVSQPKDKVEEEEILPTTRPEKTLSDAQLQGGEVDYTEILDEDDDDEDLA